MASPHDQTPEESAGESSAEEQTGTKKEKKVSCQPCREAKVKCIPSTSSQAGSTEPLACTRCLKLERECFYRTHKRGRKPGKIKLQQILRRLELLDRTLAEIRELNKEVGDQDASSLVEVLSWQLHRSKFFTKGSLTTSSTAGASFEGKKEASTPPSFSANLGEDGRDRARSGSTGGAGPSRIGSIGGPPRAGSIGSNMAMGVGKEMAKPRSDFNMLVDLEDHASVARVPDEFPTLSNPLKLLAQASSEESERRRFPSRPSLPGSTLRQDTTHSSDDEPHSASAIPRKRPRSTSPIHATTDSHPPTADKTEGEGSREVVESGTRSVGGDGGGGGARGWAKTYFSRGAFHPVYDNRQEFDPIDQGLMTVAQAERLIEDFYGAFGTFMHIFDPTLSTVGYIRKHSAFLLTVICSLSAEFNAGLLTATPNSAQGASGARTGADQLGEVGEGGMEGLRKENAELALRLRAHYEGMISWITSGDYKNVEMAQAFYLLASYRDMSESAMSDQTWLFLGTAIRIATELGCNLVCYSYATQGLESSSSSRSTAATGDKETGREHYQRQLRNTERLWLNLWNLEKTLASQTGQRMHLADEGVIATCSRWYRMPLALRQDEALVAQVELRRVMIGCGEGFNTHVLRSLGVRRKVDALPNANRAAGGAGGLQGEEEDPLAAAEKDQLSLQLSYFRNSVHMDLKRWEERWLPSQHSHPQTSCSSSNPDASPLQITGLLSLDYAALVTYALPLPISYSVDVTAELTLLWRDCYISCTNYMATFVDRCQRGFMTYVTNSTVVSTVYAVVFALDLARKAQRAEAELSSAEGGGGRKGEGVDFGFVSKTRVLNLARLTAKQLDQIGATRKSGSERGRSIASKYSAFLFGVLARFDAPASEAEEEGDGQEVERDAVKRGGFDEKLAGSAIGAQGRHLRRDHNHPLSHQPLSVGGGRLVPGTKASHAYSSNIHFSPPQTQTVAGMGMAGWTAPAPSPSTPSQSSSSTTAAAWNPSFGQQPNRFIPPPHQQQVQNQTQNWTDNNNPTGAGALSPATWFNHIQPNTAGAGAGVGGGGGMEQDPSWEWMMKDLDFFNVDGGGGGGEPILDQMGRLFG